LPSAIHPWNTTAHAPTDWKGVTHCAAHGTTTIKPALALVGKDEFFHVLEGRIQITNAEGVAEQFGPGDAGVIPAEFTGVFEVLEPVRKHYVIIDRAAVK